eukprot:5142882-Lingulodinium_polyedra.AAC.1
MARVPCARASVLSLSIVPMLSTAVRPLRHACALPPGVAPQNHVRVLYTVLVPHASYACKCAGEREGAIW